MAPATAATIAADPWAQRAASQFAPAIRGKLQAVRHLDAVIECVITVRSDCERLFYELNEGRPANPKQLVHRRERSHHRGKRCPTPRARSGVLRSNSTLSLHRRETEKAKLIHASEFFGPLRRTSLTSGPSAHGNARFDFQTPESVQEGQKRFPIN